MAENEKSKICFYTYYSIFSFQSYKTIKYLKKIKKEGTSLKQNENSVMLPQSR